MRRAPALVPLLLAACGPTTHEPRLTSTSDDHLPATPASTLGDPAVTAAINQPIMTDPMLSQSSNADAIRPPSRPDPISMPADDLGEQPDPVDARTLRHAPGARPCARCKVARVSLTLGALAATLNPACATDIRYDLGWTARLSPILPPYPNAGLIEAAGSDAAPCRARAVSFTTAAPASKVVDWYFTRATAAHVTAEHQGQEREHVLVGAGPGVRYMLYLTERRLGGTKAELVMIVD